MASSSAVSSPAKWVEDIFNGRGLERDSSWCSADHTTFLLLRGESRKRRWEVCNWNKKDLSDLNLENPLCQYIYHATRLSLKSFPIFQHLSHELKVFMNITKYPSSSEQLFFQKTFIPSIKARIYIINQIFLILCGSFRLHLWSVSIELHFVVWQCRQRWTATNLRICIQAHCSKTFFPLKLFAAVCGAERLANIDSGPYLHKLAFPQLCPKSIF